MKRFSEEGHRIVNELAQRHGFSTAAVAHLLVAIMAGRGVQAQFNNAELGGMGQWAQGGSVMIGDMLNHGLKARVEQLCKELAIVVRHKELMTPDLASNGDVSPAAAQNQAALAAVAAAAAGAAAAGVAAANAGMQTGQGMRPQSPAAAQNTAGQFPAGQGPGNHANAGWPAEYGQPAAAGNQANLRFGFFPAIRRLLIEQGGKVIAYDTRDHLITSVSQQMVNGVATLVFNSQHGMARVSDLDIVSPGRGNGPAAAVPAATSQAQAQAVPRPVAQIPNPPALRPMPPAAQQNVIANAVAAQQSLANAQAVAQAPAMARAVMPAQVPVASTVAAPMMAPMPANAGNLATAAAVVPQPAPPVAPPVQKPAVPQAAPQQQPGAQQAAPQDTARAPVGQPAAAAQTAAQQAAIQQAAIQQAALQQAAAQQAAIRQAASQQAAPSHAPVAPAPAPPLQQPLQAAQLAAAIARASQGLANPQQAGQGQVTPAARQGLAGDIIDVIERLAGLRDRGILTNGEFDAKKTDLLARI